MVLVLGDRRVLIVATGAVSIEKTPKKFVIAIAISVCCRHDWFVDRYRI